MPLLQTKIVHLYIQLTNVLSVNNYIHRTGRTQTDTHLYSFKWRSLMGLKNAQYIFSKYYHIGYLYFKIGLK